MSESNATEWSPSIFVLGHPLIDLAVYTNGEALLQKYDLRPNNGIHAEERHMPIYEEIVKDYNVVYIAGGTANVAQAAAYVMAPGSVFYTGCVGDDDLKEQLSAANARAGVLEICDVRKGEKTGACAVIITGHHRSLVTTLRAAKQFDRAWLNETRISRMIDSARVFYVEGYFLSHGVESLVALAKRSTDAGKTFALNISAPFVPQFYKPELDALLPLADIVICNQEEAAAWARAFGVPDDNTTAIARSLSTLPRVNASKPRIVVITQGSSSTILATSTETKVYPIQAVPDDLIVDTNGAGDAFAGGFLAGYAQNKSLAACIDAGHRMGALCVQSVGSQLKWPKTQRVG
ncbi:adenosine kinase [Vararia minispora EC-137]|uniref:Adenosine kinase n=1 Tax=Vararia minispora EC-137 TaxID=1314806 RepID=A0ACB8QBB6_9AGAM|nr:adenosine kinase [Vararia minispora EC-137]